MAAAASYLPQNGESIHYISPFRLSTTLSARVVSIRLGNRQRVAKVSLFCSLPLPLTLLISHTTPNLDKPIEIFFFFFPKKFPILRATLPMKLQATNAFLQNQSHGTLCLYIKNFCGGKFQIKWFSWYIPYLLFCLIGPGTCTIE